MKFASASYEHSLTTALWQITGADDLLDAYRDTLAAHGQIPGEMRLALRLTTSDAGISGANIYPLLISGDKSLIISLGNPLKLAHKDSAVLSQFDKQLNMVYAQYTEAVEGLGKLLDIEVEYPANAMLGVAKKVGVGKKLAYQAAELFKAQAGDAPCTAHEVYFGLSEVLNMMVEDRVPATRMTKMEENVARALCIRWADYDIPDEPSW